ncbi:ribosomal protein L7/L12 [Myxococcota bacterium]|nr:ribosomal protein L7/L12 [Myxococcota bacterium]MBU1535057.1 ribosomal protein L7/L12 [Myxococcota bacterium]
MAVPGGTCQVAGHHEKQQLLALFNSVGASVTLFSEPVSFPLLEAPDSEAVVTGDRFEVILTESGDHKISVIKELRAVTGLGLKESKHLADNGGTIATNVDSHAAKELVLTFTRLGARISLRPV